MIICAGGAILAVGLLAVAPLLRSTDHFVVHAGDARVRYEPGAEDAAVTVARALPEAIATVERAHFRPFGKPVRIYVCATTTSFDRYGRGVQGAGGFVLNERLFLSPKPTNTAERLPRLLVHELSHLHLEQQLGMIRAARRLPGWFKEGLAVFVAKGGGAETVNESAARDAIVSGRVFRLDRKGSVLHPQTPSRDGLDPHLFYRESAMFVAFLARQNPTAFERLLGGIHDGDAFALAVQRAFGVDLPVLWQRFVQSLAPPPDSRS